MDAFTATSETTPKFPRLTVRFRRTNGLEQAFRQESTAEYRQAVLINMLIANVLFDSFVISDYIMTGDAFWFYVAGRFLVSTPLCLLATLIAWKSDRFYQFALWMFPVAMTSSLTYMLTFSHGDYRINYMYGDLLIMVGMTVLSRPLVITTTASVVAQSLLYEMLVFTTDIVSPVQKVVFNLFCICAVVISVFASYLLETSERRAFALKRSLKRLNRELELLAEIDPLTGLGNRRALERALRFLWAAGDSAAVSIIMLDVDFFKSFNDFYGHPAGDDCLKRISGCVLSSLRDGLDLAVRIGGEEIAVLLTKADQPQANIVAERIRTAIVAEAIPHKGRGLDTVVTASFGVSTGFVRNCSSELLMQRADEALYRAKRAGRNQVV